MLAVVVGRMALARLFGFRSRGGADAERVGALLALSSEKRM